MPPRGAGAARRGVTFAILEFAVGLFITGVTLVDVFSTILVPGPSRGELRVAARLSRLILPIARRIARGRAGPGSRPANSFAPMLLVLVALGWLLLLLFGFALMFYAVGSSFTPPLRSFDQTLYIAGSSLLTLGVSEVDAHGLARWLILASALSGFAVVTATISFIAQVQSGLHQREPAVLSLSGVAGRPPSGIVILETYASLGLRSELPAFFHAWRNWSAQVLHSHVSYPSLAFFHSADAESDWLAALEAVLDAATMLMAFTEDEALGAATLMHRSGSRAASRLCAVFELEPEERGGGEEASAALIGRLTSAGYRIVGDEAAASHRLGGLRGDYASRIRALSRHLGADRTHLVPTRH